jgi:serine/threonine protein phosphatase 1
MLDRLRKYLPQKRIERPVAEVPPGQRIYAIGDIHGRLDLFLGMIARIERDDAEARPADTTVILLGDLVDRGPDSAGVLAAAREWQQRRKVRILLGNHEEMLVGAIDDESVFRHILRHGGRETAFSYGVDPAEFHSAELLAAQSMLRERVPQDDLDFIATFEDSIIVGDYLFVHAGIMPGVPLDGQKSRDLRWIREPFLSHLEPHSHVVVHGHSISDGPDDRGNRIGLDTGAYQSGSLTAVALEGTSRRYIDVFKQQQAA